MDNRNIEVSRVMLPDDSNVAGNVHGGTILKLIEEAGEIIATRHCNKDRQGPECYAALARVERTDFLEPMFVGEIAQIHAELSYASDHSLEVQCTVYSENVVKGNRRLTNRASLWYVALAIASPHTVTLVPPLKQQNDEDQEKGKRRYEAQKASRDQASDHLNVDDEASAPGMINVLTPASRSLCAPYSVNYSQSSLIVMLHPSDCNSSSFASGGSTMKMMDNVAGIVALRHCKSNVVTASVEAVNFHHVVKLGHVMTITGRPVFSSNRTLDIEVFVDCEDLVLGKSFRACSATFTFVSLDKKGQTIQIPELKVETDVEKLRFGLARKRYTAKKESRKRKAETINQNSSTERQMSVN